MYIFSSPSDCSVSPSHKNHKDTIGTCCDCFCQIQRFCFVGDFLLGSKGVGLDNIFIYIQVSPEWLRLLSVSRVSFKAEILKTALS